MSASKAEMNAVVYTAMFRCEACAQAAPHELHYAGRLLAATRCEHCGHVVARDRGRLRSGYVHDIEQRLRTKPARMTRRFLRHPVRSATALPRAVLAKPRRLLDELKLLHH